MLHVQQRAFYMLYNITAMTELGFKLTEQALVGKLQLKNTFWKTIYL